MKKILMATAAVAMFATGAMAQSVAVGQEGLGYERRGMALTDRLSDWESVTNFSGSEDIARAVCENPDETPVGIVQVDAIWLMEQEGCTLRILGDYPAKEYAFVLFPPGSPYNEFDDMKSGSKIYVNEEGSGTSLFWDVINQIEAEHGNGSSWTEAEAVRDSFVFAQSMGETGEFDIMLVVGDPNSSVVHDLIAAGWKTGELKDKDFNDMSFRRGSLYTKENVLIDLPGWGGKHRENAVLVRSFWVVNADWARENPDELKKVARFVKTIK